MALSETIEYDKITVSQPYAAVNVRKATVVKRDNEEIARSFERYSLSPGYYNESDVFVETDISGQPTEVQTICNAVWTTDIVAAWKAKLIADKPSEPSE